MNITKKSILGYGMCSSLISNNWLRKHTPFTKDGKAKMITSVEFEIDYHDIEKLERNITNDKEYVMCFVHFDAHTQKLEGIYFSIWCEDNAQGDVIVPTLNECEKKILVDYAIQELKESTQC